MAESRAWFRETYCVFSGGGAGGVSHVGVLKAVEEREDEYELAGFAGTSAGAIVALLASAGYRGEEIIGELKDGRLASLLDALGLDKATDLLGSSWRPIATLRWIARGGVRVVLVFLALFITVTGVIGLAWLAGGLGWSIAVFLLLSALASLSLRRFRGLASLDPLETALRRLINEKLGREPKQPLPFKIFDPDHPDALAGTRPLYVVASNLTARRLHLFSPETTPDVCMVDAVVASAALPLIFRPKSIRTSTLPGGYLLEAFADGGLVSNLPAWAVEARLVKNRDAIVITSELGGLPKPIDNPMKSSAALLMANVRTTIFGGSELNIRGLDRHIAIYPEFEPEPGRAKDPDVNAIDVLDFDARSRDIDLAVSFARDIARLRLSIEKSLHNYMEELQTFMTSVVLRERSLSVGAGDAEVRVRTALGAVINYRGLELDGFKLRYCKGFENNADERARYQKTGSVFEEAVAQSPETAEAIFLNLDKDARRRAFRGLGRDNWADKLSPGDISWTICAPTHILINELGLEMLEKDVMITVDGNVPLTDDELEKCADALEDFILDHDIVPA